MTLLLVFVFSLFTIFALWLAIAPFIGADRGLRLEYLDEEVREIEMLVARRQMLLTSLRELDFDRETEKIAADDYERFRRRYENEAVAIMRRLDEIHGGRDWQQRVDDELTERLGKPPQIRGAEEVEEVEEDPVEADAAEAAEAQPAEVAGAEDEVEDEQPAVEDAEDAAPQDDSEEDEDSGTLDLEDVPQLRCVTCDTLLASDDKFCSQCGTPTSPSKPTEPATSEASA